MRGPMRGCTSIQFDTYEISEDTKPLHASPTIAQLDSPVGSPAPPPRQIQLGGQRSHPHALQAATSNESSQPDRTPNTLTPAPHGRRLQGRSSGESGAGKPGFNNATHKRHNPGQTQVRGSSDWSSCVKEKDSRHSDRRKTSTALQTCSS